MGRVVCVISPNLVALGPYKCSPKNLDLSGISLMSIFAGDHPQRLAARALKCSALLSLATILHIISRNLQTVQDRSVIIND